MKVKRMVSWSGSPNEEITIPQGEFWKVTLYADGNNASDIPRIFIGGNSIEFAKGTSHNAALSEGVKIKMNSSTKATFQGLAFEI